MTLEEEVDAFLEHHGVKGMLPGFPKTNLDRISRMARGTAKKKAVDKKIQDDLRKKAEADAAKVQAHEKATVVIDDGPTKRLPNVKPTSTNDKNPGKALVQALLKKSGTIRVVDLVK